MSDIDLKKPLDWLYAYFSKKGKIPGDTKEDQLNVDYFDTGLIDSLGLIELVTAIESNFGMTLTSKDMQDQNFRTIKGLAGIIKKKMEN